MDVIIGPIIRDRMAASDALIKNL